MVLTREHPPNIREQAVARRVVPETFNSHPLTCSSKIRIVPV